MMVKMLAETELMSQPSFSLHAHNEVSLQSSACLVPKPCSHVCERAGSVQFACLGSMRRAQSGMNAPAYQQTGRIQPTANLAAA